MKRLSMSSSPGLPKLAAETSNLTDAEVPAQLGRANGRQAALGLRNSAASLTSRKFRPPRLVTTSQLSAGVTTTSDAEGSASLQSPVEDPQLEPSANRPLQGLKLRRVMVSPAMAPPTASSNGDCSIRDHAAGQAGQLLQLSPPAAAPPNKKPKVSLLSMPPATATAQGLRAPKLAQHVITEALPARNSGLAMQVRQAGVRSALEEAWDSDAPGHVSKKATAKLPAAGMYSIAALTAANTAETTQVHRSATSASEDGQAADAAQHTNPAMQDTANTEPALQRAESAACQERTITKDLQHPMIPEAHISPASAAHLLQVRSAHISATVADIRGGDLVEDGARKLSASSPQPHARQPTQANSAVSGMGASNMMRNSVATQLQLQLHLLGTAGVGVRGLGVERLSVQVTPPAALALEGHQQSVSPYEQVLQAPVQHATTGKEQPSSQPALCSDGVPAHMLAAITTRMDEEQHVGPSPAPDSSQAASKEHAGQLTDGVLKAPVIDSSGSQVLPDAMLLGSTTPHSSTNPAESNIPVDSCGDTAPASTSASAHDIQASPCSSPQTAVQLLSLDSSGHLVSADAGQQQQPCQVHSQTAAAVAAAAVTADVQLLSEALVAMALPQAGVAACISRQPEAGAVDAFTAQDMEFLAICQQPMLQLRELLRRPLSSHGTSLAAMPYCIDDDVASRRLSDDGGIDWALLLTQCS